MPAARFPVLVLLALSALLAPPAAAGPDDGTLSPPPDAALAPWRQELLDIALASAAKMPLVPHLRNRARAQEVAVTACLQLDQPARALRAIESIPNWRRGTGYADYALWCVEHGAAEGVQHWLDLAQQIADGPADEESQDWQRGRIRARIAAVHLKLGQAAQAERVGAGTEPADTGVLQAARAAAAEDFDATVKGLDAQVATNDFDSIRGAQQGFLQLHERFYADAERRALLEARLRDSGARLPVDLRIDGLLDLSAHAAAQGDAAHALELVNEAQALHDAASFTRVVEVARLARLAERRAAAGDAQQARQQVTAALALYEAGRERIVDIERAAALRAVAEALQSMDDSAGALAVYRKAVEEGAANPNSRPRADDLVATCCSMALHGVQPDEALWQRLHAIADGLADPW